MTTQVTREPFIRDRSWAFDFALCTVVALIVVTPFVAESTTEAVLSLLLVLPLMLRRQAPRVALTVGILAALAHLVLLAGPTASVVAVPILIYSMARWKPGVLGRIAVLVGLAGSVLGPLRWIFGYGFSSIGGVAGFGMTALACAGLCAAAYAIGRRRRERSENSAERARSQLERQQLLVSEEEQRQRMATVNERNRIARELHDIVAHSLSVIVVQAEGGKALATKRPEKGPEVLGTIAETSREALEEMRRMVGLLRSDPEPQQATYLPMPGLDDIPELVRKTSDRAELVGFGHPPQVSQALGLTAYRIVQESLTNVLKHAGPAARARVTTAYTAEAVELEITDDGPGVGADSDGHGHGLQGMHERVALHGGRLLAEPRAGGGFVVRASLPLSGDTTVVLPAAVGPHAAQSFSPTEGRG